MIDPRQCACCAKRYTPDREEQTVCPVCVDHDACCTPGSVEVTREEWDNLTPDQREARNIRIIRERSGFRVPVYQAFRVRKPPIKL